MQKAIKAQLVPEKKNLREYLTLHCVAVTKRPGNAKVVGARWRKHQHDHRTNIVLVLNFDSVQKLVIIYKPAAV